MTGKPLRLLSVGKLKVPFWKDAAAHYSQRINRWRRLECMEVRDGDPALPQAQRNELEGRRLLEALGPQDVPLVLDERGITMTSPQLAQLLQKIDNNAMGRACFIIGGAYGLDEAVRQRAWKLVSLSSYDYSLISGDERSYFNPADNTIRCEAATVFTKYVLLLEQLYRAECIIRKVPYHH